MNRMEQHKGNSGNSGNSGNNGKESSSSSGNAILNTLAADDEKGIIDKLSDSVKTVLGISIAIPNIPTKTDDADDDDDDDGNNKLKKPIINESHNAMTESNTSIKNEVPLKEMEQQTIEDLLSRIKVLEGKLGVVTITPSTTTTSTPETNNQDQNSSSQQDNVPKSNIKKRIEARMKKMAGEEESKQQQQQQQQINNQNNPSLSVSYIVQQVIEKKMNQMRHSIYELLQLGHYNNDDVATDGKEGHHYQNDHVLLKEERIIQNDNVEHDNLLSSTTGIQSPNINETQATDDEKKSSDEQKVNLTVN